MLTRRRFLASAGGLAAATILAPASLDQALAGTRRVRQFGKASFPDGVVSGDPTPDGAVLWTRLDDVAGTGAIDLEVAKDRGFRHVVARKSIATNANKNFTAKAAVKGLDPHERYYYRFASRRSHSPIGRFQTALPSGSKETVRFAFFSCQEYTFGYYNAHALMARDDLDFVLNLGDYIYSDVYFGPPQGVRAANFTTSMGLSAITLDEYRQRYQVYRSDENLQRLHSRFPMISCWDDHEVQNDYSGGDPNGGAASGDPYTPERRDNAYRAFFEQMPTFPIGTSRLYHKASFGRTMDLFVLDERQYRATDPCGDKAGAPCGDLDEPRTMLGAAQLPFLTSGLSKSKATWKVIANEVIMSVLKANATNLADYDAWDGFPVEREAILRTVAKTDGVIFASGDYHTTIVSDVQTADGTTVAPEFGGLSITSFSDAEVASITGQPGFGTPDNPTIPPEQLQTVISANPWFIDYDPIHHGYVRCEASSSTFKATVRKLETVRQVTTALASEDTYTVHRGQRGVRG
jgi:alkaline phosphatase D